MWLAIALGIAWGGCATQRPERGTLDALQVTAREIRAGRAVASLPALDALIGASRSALVSALGAPRDCRFPLEQPCRAIGETVWTLGGAQHEDAHAPVLVVRLDDARRVIDAEWRRDGH
ncbi:hypothetical protein DB32_007801 [Sandaracinus amylolyticus]|uniref:Uncharacterized protein n=2 Tax=Sandaracinus amylolyticus TaxID=927083 RepID=A0A0F6W9B9_9BACT|nr:hypothetical protein DB32_007801 [Sandaracinus amylolyticus]